MAQVAKLIALRRGENISNNRGIGTRRFIEYIEEATEQINDTVDSVATSFNIEVLASIADLNERLGSGDFLTSDSDSFSVDSDKFTVDMTEA